MAKICLQVCCASCLARALTAMTAHGINAAEVRLFWFNPNLHPLIEYRRRLKAFKMFLERAPHFFGAPFTAEIRDVYGLTDFCRRLNDNQGISQTKTKSVRETTLSRDANETPDNFSAPARCEICYNLRLTATAQFAAANSDDFFATTLMSSREQNHALLKAVGEKVAAAVGKRFFYLDCRTAEPPLKLVHGLYKQAYCGCVFSEAERYVNTNLHLFQSSLEISRSQGAKPK